MGARESGTRRRASACRGSACRRTAGGAGGTVADGVAVLGVAGRHAAPIPLAETGLLAGWLLSAAGLPVGHGPNTVVPGRAEDDLRLVGDRLHGTAHRVAWARAAERIVALVDGKVVAVAPSRARIEPVTNLAGEPRDTVVFDGAERRRDRRRASTASTPTRCCSAARSRVPGSWPARCSRCPS